MTGVSKIGKGESKWSISALKCTEFIEKLASKSPVPGGGGASALVGTIGTALCNMVGSLTVEKEICGGVEAEIIDLMEQATALQNKLLRLIEEDAEAFEPLSKAYGLPSGTEEEKAEKDRVMEECLRKACSVPMEIIENLLSGD